MLLHLIRLYRMNCFLQFWYGPCSFSKICFTEITFLHLFDPQLYFFTFVRIENDVHWILAKICPTFSPWTPILTHFMHFGIMFLPDMQPDTVKFIIAAFFVLPSSSKNASVKSTNATLIIALAGEMRQYN